MLSASPRMSGFIYQVGMLNLKLQGVRCEKGNQITLTEFKSSVSLHLSVVVQMLQAGNQGLVLPCLPGHLVSLSCQLVKQCMVSVNAVKLVKKKKPKPSQHVVLHAVLKNSVYVSKVS